MKKCWYDFGGAFFLSGVRLADGCGGAMLNCGVVGSRGLWNVTVIGFELWLIVVIDLVIVFFRWLHPCPAPSGVA